MSEELEVQIDVMSIGLITGGQTRENQAWSDAARSLVGAVIRARGGFETHGVRLNVVFTLLGSS